ncbi:MAG: autotransporter-associated beta strand repeat-containing protein, partial [Kiritimatiellae bacterium]|nr:autotransporter-associated beta strand repeat-containing protein [Kiritimatiellia bacterium]
YTAVVPGTGDTAVFGTSAEVLVSASAYAGETRLDADVTFSGEAKLQCPLWRGYGKLSLAGITLTAPTEGDFIISNNVEVVAKTTNTLTLETAASNSESDYRYIYLEGNMTGAGYLALDQRSRQGLAGGKFSGDNREFSGEIEVVNCKDNRDTTQFIGAHSTSSNAVYTVYGKGDSGNTVSMFPTQNTTYYIGSIDGNVQQARAGAPGNVILEIGALNRNNSIGGHFGASNKTAIRKVGTAKLTCSAANIGDVEIASGTYEVTKNTQSGNITFTGNGIFRSTPEASASVEIDYAKKFVGSTDFPIVFDDGDTNRTWASAIPASNKAGFTKMGSGTLTLEKVPLYTGLTTVKEGTLVVPEGSDITYNPLSAGTLTGVTPTKFAYPAGTTLTGAETTKTFDGVLDISNVAAIDVSGATLVKGQPYVIASATTVTGFTKDTIELTLPAGTDTAKWTVKIMSIDAKRSLCVAPPTNPFVIIVR